MDLGIHADFLLMEASRDPLHGCWLEQSIGKPIARVNANGMKGADGKYSQPYSKKYTGICKSKGCDETEYTYQYYHYMSRLSDKNYCDTCKESTCMSCAISLVFFKSASAWQTLTPTASARRGIRSAETKRSVYYV